MKTEIAGGVFMAKSAAIKAISPKTTITDKIKISNFK